MFNSSNLRERMVVQTADGENLGKVHSFDVTHFKAGKGLFFREDYDVAYEDIREIRNGVIVLAQDKEHFLNQPLWPKTPVERQRAASVEEDEEGTIRRPMPPIEPVRSNESVTRSEPGVVHFGSPGRDPKEG